MGIVMFKYNIFIFDKVVDKENYGKASTYYRDL